MNKSNTNNKTGNINIYNTVAHSQNICNSSATLTASYHFIHTEHLWWLNVISNNKLYIGHNMKCPILCVCVCVRACVRAWTDTRQCISKQNKSVFYEAAPLHDEKASRVWSELWALYNAAIINYERCVDTCRWAVCFILVSCCSLISLKDDEYERQPLRKWSHRVEMLCPGPPAQQLLCTQKCTLLGYYTVNSSNSLPTFQDNLSVPSYIVKSTDTPRLRQ
jgi:hypothetical protein